MILSEEEEEIGGKKIIGISEHVLNIVFAPARPRVVNVAPFRARGEKQQYFTQAALTYTDRHTRARAHEWTWLKAAMAFTSLYPARALYAVCTAQWKSSSFAFAPSSRLPRRRADAMCVFFLFTLIYLLSSLALDSSAR